MPIRENLQPPSSAQALPLAEGSAAATFLCFISSTDPATNQSWCPDVRAALPRLEAAFSRENDPELIYVHVGQKPEWKTPENTYRKIWNVNMIPTLVRYERVDGEIQETGRLIEGELLDVGKFQNFIEK